MTEDEPAIDAKTEDVLSALRYRAVRHNLYVPPEPLSKTVLDLVAEGYAKLSPVRAGPLLLRTGELALVLTAKGETALDHPKYSRPP